MYKTQNEAKIILGPIIGGLSHERVNLWARANKSAVLYAWLATNQNAKGAKLVGKKQLQASNGFAGIVPIKDLKPDKKYFFALTLNSKLVPPKSAFQPFRSFPAPGKAKDFRFAFGSCFLPYKTKPGLAFKHIRENQKDIAFMFFLGDQIYADNINSNGLRHVPVNVNEYRKVYETVWSNPHHRELLAQTPAFMILDDHEVDNDWRWKDRSLKTPSISNLELLIRKLRRAPAEEQQLTLSRTYAALKTNWEHQAMHAPLNLPLSGPLNYEFEYGVSAFFIMDTRTQRFIDKHEREMLGDKQWKKLKAWLKRVKNTHPVKFIISSVSIMSDIIGDPTSDRWAGFDQERERLFKFLADEEIEGIHILSGDLHSAHSISADLQNKNGKSIQIREFCSSPFEQKPSKLAWLLDHPTRSPSLKNQKRHFTVSEINYGVVEVGFSSTKKPQVRFNLNYENNGSWFVK